MWETFKGMLGLLNLDNSAQRENPFRPPICDTREVVDSESDNAISSNTQSVTVFTNPLEMHFYFEREMDKLLKNVFDFSIITQKVIEVDATSDVISRSSSTLRDEFLKPRYSEITSEDSDLDGRISSDDIQGFLGAPFQQAPQLNTIYSRSVTVKTVRRPDGTIETVRSEKDNTGREETTTTVTRLDYPKGTDIFTKLFF